MHTLKALGLFALALPLPAQEALDRNQLLALARRRAPVALASPARIDEARSRLAGASVFWRDNPTVDAEIGRRTTAAGKSFKEFTFGVSQTLELGGKRSARIAEARAGVERETAAVGDALRQLLRDVSIAYFQVIAAQQRLKIALAAKANASELFAISDRRFKAGDIAQLPFNLARNSVARANAEVKAAEAGEISADSALRILLGLKPDEPLSVVGSLDEPAGSEEGYLALIDTRADVRVLEAELKAAQAIGRIGDSLKVPDLAAGIGQKREEGADATVARVGITLPVFNRGQEQSALAQARKRRVEIELNALKAAIRHEVVAALAVNRKKAEAAQELSRIALPQLDENERLTVRSYEEGEIGLAELLLIRRETFETRREYVTRALEAALALVDLEFVSGVWQ